MRTQPGRVVLLSVKTPRIMAAPGWRARQPDKGGRVAMRARELPLTRLLSAVAH